MYFHYRNTVTDTKDFDTQLATGNVIGEIFSTSDDSLSPLDVSVVSV